MTAHTLKIDRYWWWKLNSDKTGEIRRNDRDFQKGDEIYFDVTDDNGDSLGWSGRQFRWEITHVLPLHMFIYGVEAAPYVMLSLKAPDADYWEDEARQLRVENTQLRRSNGSLRGAMTKLRNRIGGASC